MKSEVVISEIAGSKQLVDINHLTINHEQRTILSGLTGLKTVTSLPTNH